MPAIVIDTAPIKQNILSSQGKLALLTLVQGFPSCDSDNSAQNTQIILSQCLPAGADLNKYATENSILLSSLIPKEIQLDTKQFFPPSFLDVIHTLRSAIKHFVLISSILLVLALLVIIINIFLYRNLMKKFFIILSLPFYLSASLFLLLYAAGSILINEYYRWYTLIQLTQDEAINQLAARFGTALIQLSCSKALLTPSAFLLLGSSFQQFQR
jgi:hypothetical protein